MNYISLLSSSPPPFCPPPFFLLIIDHRLPTSLQVLGKFDLVIELYMYLCYVCTKYLNPHLSCPVSIRSASRMFCWGPSSLRGDSKKDTPTYMYAKCM